MSHKVIDLPECLVEEEADRRIAASSIASGVFEDLHRSIGRLALHP